jgi:energy-coupling factor transporter ATP-binding protein EcfA2
VWAADSRRDEVIEGLGVAGLGLDRRIDEVSGGQRTRFALAALLLGAPDALLLDEPTNHLDDDAASFLEERLRAWRGPVLFASHDREFLDRVATGLLDLDPGRRGALALAGSRADEGTSRVDVLAASGGTVFGGGFSEFLTVKAEERDRWRRQYEDEQDELRRLRASVAETARHVSHGRAATDNDKFLKHFKRGNVERAVSRRVRNAEHRLEALEREQVRKPPTPLAFAGIPSGSHALEEASGLLLQASGVSVEGGSTSMRSRWHRSRGCSSRARTARASRRCSACSPARRASTEASCIVARGSGCNCSSRTCASPIRMPRRAACTSACSASDGPNRCRCPASGSSRSATSPGRSDRSRSGSSAGSRSRW